MENAQKNLTTAALQDSQKVSKLEAVLEAHKGETHVIALQDFPDPDAIASAFAHKLICLKYGIEADIVYTGIQVVSVINKISP